MSWFRTNKAGDEGTVNTGRKHLVPHLVWKDGSRA
jgi:hypothetical protein